MFQLQKHHDQQKKVLKCIENDKTHHHEMKLAQTDYNPPSKKTSSNLSCLFFEWSPKLPNSPTGFTRAWPGFMETRNCGFRYHDNMGALVFERPPPMNKLKGRSCRRYFLSQKTSWWWVEPTHLEKICTSQNGIISPRVLG